MQQLKRFHRDGRRSSDVRTIVMCSESRGCSLKRVALFLTPHQRLDQGRSHGSEHDHVLNISSLFGTFSLDSDDDGFFLFVCFFSDDISWSSTYGPQLLLTEASVTVVEGFSSSPNGCVPFGLPAAAPPDAGTGTPVCSDTFCSHLHCNCF